MGATGILDAELSRLDGALAALESAAERVRTAQPDRNDDAVAAIEAERDLIQLKHRRLVQETETALGQIDRLIAGAGSR